MKLSRRSLFKLGTIAAAGLALPATDILADAEEIAKRYWALDQTQMTSALIAPSPWWNVARIVGENRYHTSIKAEVVPDHLRVGDALVIGDLPEGASSIDGLEREVVHIRHIDRSNGIVTVTTPVSYPSRLPPQYGRLAGPQSDPGIWVPEPHAYGKYA